MVGPSKILTVSYGTFSCTLEGFDDSFSTMKAIAEYFRGLASDDRYFGAEPPTPDADMLAKIAEGEISRRVAAHTHGSNIVLRASALSDQSSGASDPSDSAHDADTSAEVEAARKAAKAARKAEKVKAKVAAKAAKGAAKAAKADADAKAAADAKVEADAKAASEATSDDIPQDAPDLASDTSPLGDEDATTQDAQDEASEIVAEETEDDASPSAPAASDPEPELVAKVIPSPVIAAHPDADSVADKLQRIRALVDNTNDAENASADDLSEQFLPQSETPDMSDVDQIDPQEGAAHQSKIKELAPSSATDADASDETGAPEEDGSDTLARFMAQQSEPEDSAKPEEQIAEPQTEAADDNSDDADEVAATQPQVRVIRMKLADFDSAVQKGEIGAQTKAPTPITGPDLGMLDGAEDLDDYLEDSDFTDTDTEMLNIEDEDFANDLDEIEADFERDAAVELSAADLADDVASHSRDAMSTGQIAMDVTSDDDASENAFHAAEPQVNDAALDRLMSESDLQMKEPEGSRRRDAIAQLKAAVAAKQAAHQVGETEDDGQEDVENEFRNDLCVAVHPEGTDSSGAVARPRPVVRSSTRTERPRPAPLKLVAAQRIDIENTNNERGPAAPVVPRRVAARKEDAQAQAAGSFAEFAKNMDATKLPDLLEAAAAYTAFVEGADEFSRPQLLRRVRSVSSGEFNREDGLRSFADLLREGRFTKVRNGRFQVADDSRYNPERRAG
jgi:hypothetical protein